MVDDSAVNRRAISRRLIADGLGVREADALDTGRSLDVRSALCAILDLDLGDGSGVELALIFREQAHALPIAFFSASAAPELIAEASKLGPVFSKPDELDAAIAWVLPLLVRK